MKDGKETWVDVTKDAALAFLWWAMFAALCFFVYVLAYGLE